VPRLFIIDGSKALGASRSRRWARFRSAEFPRRYVDQHQVHRPLAEPVLRDRTLPARQRQLGKAGMASARDLGVTKSQSRPHTSNDNPFSESHFKTMKYQPQFPQRFGCIQDAKTFCRSFFAWYNQDHHHAGIGLMTPDQVHYGQANQVHAARQITPDGAFSRNPERFVRKEPEPPKPCRDLDQSTEPLVCAATINLAGCPHRSRADGGLTPGGPSISI
jgi:hypothetical protein